MIKDDVLDLGSCLKVWLMQRLVLFNNIINELEEELADDTLKRLEK